ncbi:MAG: hypothetical protein DME34_03620, partial [Verrucomicrobia bacterium]
MVRLPLGGHVWHHFQYLAGLQQLGHEVTYFEDFGWPDSCYQPPGDVNTSDPSFGIAYLLEFLGRYGVVCDICYLAEDGTARGLSRAELAARCREADLYLNLSNMNAIPEQQLCRCRVLVDTDPVFTQIGALRFTFGENVHQPGCSMPTADMPWLPTRQPVVTDLWPVDKGHLDAPFTTVMSWNPMTHGDDTYGSKARAFTPFLRLPQITGEPMEIAINVRARRVDPLQVRAKLARGGWRVRDAAEVTHTPWSYQQYLQSSRAEFSVAKHGYVVTQCGWFSDRGSSYLASGRPVILQDTG